MSEHALFLPIKPSPEILQILRDDSKQYVGYLDKILLFQDYVLHYAPDGKPYFSKAEIEKRNEDYMNLGFDEIVLQNLRENQAVHVSLLEELRSRVSSMDELTIMSLEDQNLWRIINTYLAQIVDIYRLVRTVTPDVIIPPDEEFETLP